MEAQIPPEHFGRFLDSLLQGDKAACASLVAQLLDRNISPQALYVELFARALYEVGHRWESGQVSVALEHMATLMIEDLLAQVFARFPKPKEGRKKAIVFCGADEFHQVGGRMVADTLELSGWNVAFLGANTSTEELLAMVHKAKPELVALSVTLEKNLDRGLDVLHALRLSHPGLLLVAGGQAVQRNRSRVAVCEGVKTPNTLNELLALFPS